MKMETGKNKRRERKDKEELNGKEKTDMVRK